MNSLAIGLVLLSALMHALRSFLTKQAENKEAFVFSYELVGLFFFLPVFLDGLVQYGLPQGWEVLLLIGLAGSCHFFYWLFLAKALEAGELSHVYPITRSSPAVVLLLSPVILKETPHWLGVLGVLLIVLGVILISQKELKLPQWKAPTGWRPATRFAILTLVFVSGYSILDKFAVTKIQPALYNGLFPWLSVFLFYSCILRKKGSRLIWKEMASQRRPILICGFLSTFGYFLILLAFQLAPASYVVGLRQTSVLFAVFLGSQFLGEGQRGLRAFAAGLIFAGSLLISVAPAGA